MEVKKGLSLPGSFTREEVQKLITLYSISHADAGPAGRAVESEILFGLREGGWYFRKKGMEVMKCLSLLSSFTREEN